MGEEILVRDKRYVRQQRWPIINFPTPLGVGLANFGWLTCAVTARFNKTATSTTGAFGHRAGVLLSDPLMPEDGYDGDVGSG